VFVFRFRDVVLAKLRSKNRMIKINLSVISVNAPTFRSPQEHKDQFYHDLMCTIKSVSQDDVLLIVGDFTASWDPTR